MMCVHCSCWYLTWSYRDGSCRDGLYRDGLYRDGLSFPVREQSSPLRSGFRYLYPGTGAVFLPMSPLLPGDFQAHPLVAVSMVS